MYSLNVGVPGAVRRLASELHPRLATFETVRDRHTLVCKRLGEGPPGRLRERVRGTVSGVRPFEVRIDGINYFERPTVGSSPVVYLAVESPALVELHRRLCREFEPIAGIEGDDYVPHVTLARGGSVADAERLADAEIEPATWTASELLLWSGEYREPVGRLSLPL